MKKKLFVWMLAVIFVLGAFPSVGFAAGMQGAGTENSPYLVKTKADLNGVRDNMAAYYRLENDIAFADADFASGGAFYNGGKGFLPIGSSSVSFSGSFDGGNHTISGIQQSASTAYGTGLFGDVASGSVIKNLKIKGGSVTAAAQDDVYVGGIVGSLSGTVSNCSFDGTIQSNANWWSAKNASGGIAGFANGTVTGCSNSGTIIAKSPNLTYAGGVVGEADTAVISNCTNTGKLQSDEYAGGIVGSATDGAKINGCANYAALAGGGGIAGEIEDGSIADHCYNTGSIGGGAGITPSLNGGVITYCYNTGNITGTMAAGIAGYVGKGGKIHYCYNMGSMSGTGTSGVYAAGIAGKIKDNVGDDGCEILNCFNTGALSNACTKDYACYTGGIVGWLTSYWHTVSNCYNRGSVKDASDCYNGGLVGCSDSKTAVNNCYYLDTANQGSATADIGKRVSDAQMKQQGTFAGFDFSGVWTMAGNTAYLYPELRNVTMAYNPNAGKQYTVAFDSKGGSSVAKVKAVYGNKISAPKSPSRSGYVFAGWFKDSACKTAWDFSKDTVTKDITLFAKWAYAPPGTPAISAKAAGYDSVKITWKKTARAAKYQIYRASSAGGVYKKIAETASVSYTNKGLATGRTYYYKVKAYYKKGSTTVYGSLSAVKSAAPVLAVPKSLKAARVSSGKIKLTWSKTDGAGGYEIERAASKAGPFAAIASIGGGTKTNYTNAGLTAGTVCYYRLRAYRMAGGAKVYSGYTGVVSAKP